jgi:hypothetical protein
VRHNNNTARLERIFSGGKNDWVMVRDELVSALSCSHAAESKTKTS